MGNLQVVYDDSVRFILYSGIQEPIEIDAPIGWSEDNVGLTRHKKYDGILFNYTGKLKFIGNARDFIQYAYDVGGVNENLVLLKQKTRKVEGVVKWVNEYSLIGDFTSMVKDEVEVSLNFNSGNITEVIKSHEGDVVEIERTTWDDPTPKDINGIEIPAMQVNEFALLGRGLYTYGELKIEDPNYVYVGTRITPLLVRVTQGSPLQSEVEQPYWRRPYEPSGVGPKITAANLYYEDATAPPNPIEDVTVETSYELEFRLSQSVPVDSAIQVSIRETPWIEDEYGISNTFRLLEVTNPEVGKVYKVEGSIKIPLDWYDGLLFTIEQDDRAAVPTGELTLTVSKCTIKTNRTSVIEPTQNVRFAFNHDIGERLVHILTGKTDNFYSQYFGRKNETPQNYPQDGEMYGIGQVSGFWARGFDPTMEKYKSLQISFKEWIDSSVATFNVGMGVDNIGFSERIRVEDKKFFYQDDIGLRLPFQVTNVKRKVVGKLFYSGISNGYTRGGDYDGSQGLDEPNTETNRITPINKSMSKYKQQSKTRADETALELTRRKPQSEYPDDDTARDEANWWIDLRRVPSPGSGYGQISQYEDNGIDLQPEYPLQELPTGIGSPETFRSMKFTPLQCAKRHGWIFGAGLIKYPNKLITYGASKANSYLSMLWKGATEKEIENADYPVSFFERAKFEPEEITFRHVINDEIKDIITGYKQIEYKGVQQKVRNYYFKVQFLNENQEWETGWLLDMNANKDEFKLIKSNETIL